jgi:hypothetical protein
MASYTDFLLNTKVKDKKVEVEDQESSETLGRAKAILGGLSMGRFLYPGSELQPEAENNQKLSNIESALVGTASGLLKVPEGIVSLGAELIDVGLDTNTAAKVEQFFDDLNPFEEMAQERAVGKLTEALASIGIPGAAGAKFATKLASKYLTARKAGTVVNNSAENVRKGIKTAEQLNKLTGRQKFGAIVVGGAMGETLVTDTEKIGTFGDMFEAGPTQQEEVKGLEGREAGLKNLLNRTKFGSESLLVTPFVYGAGKFAVTLAKGGRDLAYSNSAIEKALDKFGSVFRFRGQKPVQQALAKETEQATKMADTNLAMENVTRIDREMNKIFPETKRFFYSVNQKERKSFLKLLDETLFAGPLTKGLDEELTLKVIDTMSKAGAKSEGIEIVLNGLRNSREHFAKLIETASGTPGIIDLPPGLTGELSKLLGNRVKNSISNTFEIFDNPNAGFFQSYKPTSDAVDKVRDIFMRYAAKNNQPITAETADGFISDIVRSVSKMDPRKDTLPTFGYPNLTKGAQDPYNLKTFAQTVTRNLPDGKRSFEVIGKGSKAFRELFGEIEDARHSIYETMGRLSTITRRGEMFQEMLATDKVIKSGVNATTPYGQRGFFHATPLAAKQAFGPNSKIVKMPEGMQKYFPDEAIYTTEDIAEGFSSVSNLQNFMRGETGGPIGKTFSWLWRNLLLTPKAGAQFAKTILSIPTHIRNFLSSGMFSVANGTILTDPRLIAEAMNNARKVVQVGMREPEAMAKYREYLRLGVTNTNVRMGDLKNLMKDVRFGEGNIATDSVLKPMLNTLGKNVAKGVKGTGKFMQDAYVAEDDFWKIFNFEVELARLKKAYEKSGTIVGDNMIETLKQDAANIVKNTVPNYARVGSIVRAARMSPFGNFMSWPSEIFRTGYGVFNQALKEIKDPVTRAIGLKRLTGMTFATAALPLAIVEGSKAIFGVSDEESDAVNYFVAPWAVNSQKIIMKDPIDDEFYYIDWSRNNVYDTLTRPFQTVLSNIQRGIEDEDVLLKGFMKGLVESTAKTAEPFISESIFTEAFMDIVARNGMTNEGKQLYNDRTPEPEKYQIITTHLANTLMPTTQPFRRTYKAIMGQPGEYGEEFEIGPEIAGIFGMRPIKIDPKKSMGYRLYKFQRDMSNDVKNFTGGKFGVLKGGIVDPKDMIERFFIANKQLFDSQREMKQVVNAAQTLGVTEDELFELFEERGLSPRILERLLDGDVKPFIPSDNIVEKIDRDAEKLGVPSPYDAASPVMDQIIDDMYNQNLNEPFSLSLEKYLPQQPQVGDQSSTSGTPLPPTPMPNPGTFKPPMNQQMMASGLTRTEEVYLSPAEKLIRKKSRGMS